MTAIASQHPGRRATAAITVAALVLGACAEEGWAVLTSSRVKARNVSASYSGGMLSWGISTVVIGRKPLTPCKAKALIRVTPNDAGSEIVAATEWTFNACKGTRSWTGRMPVELQHGRQYNVTGQVSQSSGTTVVASQTGLLIRAP